VERPVDIYVLVRTPIGDIYSVRHDGGILKGIFPYARGYSNPDYWCGALHVHKVCRMAAVGEYTVALVLMPAGEQVKLRNALGLDWTMVGVTR